LLIKAGKPTLKLVEILRTIFSWYTNSLSNDRDLELNPVEAARLWYRCGLKVDNLQSLLKDDNKSNVAFEDFLSLITRVVREDQIMFDRRQQQQGSSTDDIQVGDKVELVEGYESKGDAASGPLQPYDRGTVVELQQRPNGQR